MFGISKLTNLSKKQIIVVGATASVLTGATFVGGEFIKIDKFESTEGGFTVCVSTNYETVIEETK